MTISEAYADLGGGIHTTQRETLPTFTPPAGCRHLYDPISGWCGCGRRNDGKLAEGSPAWRAAIDRAMPERGA
ncbi:hypothetical protein IF188_13995 [Microbacterium sp. NEAU-LLC]|uniref:Uncharacterized protein n=1 Tax=Microbacterium helvum TaxID=2773713 RepID=A0ABR8NS25_9MICO|nr:hypothetical protein [Microbacterium helvum]MBD3942808.1 hypothetical protein [Microbacterium helvum]